MQEVSSPEGEDRLFCAYCEGRIYGGASHIDHFRPKARDKFPQLTFAWENLFLSCEAGDHCGHFKDKKGRPSYCSEDLLKPDEDDPDHYLYFHSTGEVRVREGVSEADAQRGAETIKVFGLNCPQLRVARRKAIGFYRERFLGDLEELESWSEADIREYVDHEILLAAAEPYATGVKQFLRTLSS